MTHPPKEHPLNKARHFRGSRGSVRIRCLIAIATFLVSTLSQNAFAQASQTQANNVVSINVRDTDIYDVVQLMEAQANRNIVLDMPTVTHERITIKINNVSFDQALRTLADADGLTIVNGQNGIVYLGRGPSFISRYSTPVNDSIQTLQFQLQNARAGALRQAMLQQFANAMFVADDRSNTLFVWAPKSVAEAITAVIHTADAETYGGAGFKSLSIPLRYQKASDVAKMIDASIQVSKPSSLTAVDPTNSLVVIGSPDFLASVKAIAASIDRPGQQMRFDIRVADVTPINDSSNIGVEWGGVDTNSTQTAASGSTITTFANKTLQINAQINLLQSKGKASILAQPSVTTLNNFPAAVNIGEQIPIVYFDPATGVQNVQFVSAGVNLQITPIIAPNGVSTVHLVADYSQVLSYQNGYPIVGQRKVDWYGRITPDDSIVLSGLFQDTSSETIQKIPLLGDIPILGQFFRNKATNHLRDEIVFIITPHLIPDNRMVSSATPPSSM